MYIKKGDFRGKKYNNSNIQDITTWKELFIMFIKMVPLNYKEKQIETNETTVITSKEYRALN